VNVGDVVDKYRVERVVGVGAMGLVVAARHTTLDQVVAIKFLVEHGFGSKEESIARFLNEARAAARIDSDYVCRVSDVAMLASGVPYMVMEYLDGNDLEEELEARGRLEIVEAVDYVLQALDAIAAAHQLGIVHRDLKPANLFLARRPDGSRRVKVLDFGISKTTNTSATRSQRRQIKRLTKETRSLGTPAYMAPEQVTDPMHVDHRVDIWALGAILYELLTGRMAFAGDTVKEVLDRVVSEDPCPIQALRPDVPHALVAAISRALTRDREQRWQSAAMFARALAPFGSIGVLGGLTNVTREVGSLSSISPLGVATPASSMVPVAPTDVEVTEPEGTDLSYYVAQDWAALQKRKRRASTAVLGMGAAFFLAATAALLAYRVAQPRPVAAREVSAVAAVVAPSEQPAKTASAPPPAVSALPPATPSVTVSAATASAVPEPAPPPTGKQKAYVQPAKKYVHGAPKRPARPRAPTKR